MVAVPTLLSVNVTKVISITTSSDKSDKNVPFLCLKLLNLMCRTANKAEQHTIFIHVLFVFYLNFVATSVINHDWSFRRPLYSLCHPTIASPPHHYKCRLSILLISRMEPSSSYDSFRCPQLFCRYSIITFQTIIRWSFPISSYIPEHKLLNHAQHEKLPHWKIWYSRRRHFGWGVSGSSSSLSPVWLMGPVKKKPRPFDGLCTLYGTLYRDDLVCISINVLLLNTSYYMQIGLII